MIKKNLDASILDLKSSMEHYVSQCVALIFDIYLANLLI